MSEGGVAGRRDLRRTARGGKAAVPLAVVRLVSQLCFIQWFCLPRTISAVLPFLPSLFFDCRRWGVSEGGGVICEEGACKKKKKEGHAALTCDLADPLSLQTKRPILQER